MADTKAYPKGIFTFPPNANAPDWVLGSLVINLSDFKAWINGDGKQYITKYKDTDQLRLQVTSGKEKISISVDTWKKRESSDPAKANTDFVPEPESDLPF